LADEAADAAVVCTESSASTPALQLVGRGPNVQESQCLEALLARLCNFSHRQWPVRQLLAPQRRRVAPEVRLEGYSQIPIRRRPGRQARRSRTTWDIQGGEQHQMLATTQRTHLMTAIPSSPPHASIHGRKVPARPPAQLRGMPRKTQSADGGDQHMARRFCDWMSSCPALPMTLKP
jgi:hypothetical protein